MAILIEGGIDIGGGISVELGVTPPPTFNFTTPTIMNTGAFLSLLQPSASAINTAGLITAVGSNNGNFGSAVSNDGINWTGGITTGKFSRDHGKMTPKLAHMFIKLCERYATRSNWRGYTYNDEMRSQALLQLSQIGLQFDESKSQNPFAYYTAAITNSFTRVLNIEKRNQNLRDDILEMNNLTPSYTRQGDWGAGIGHGADE